MKRVFLFFVAALMSVAMFAAETEYLPISVYAGEESEVFPQGAKAMIENKLTQLLTQNGIAGMNYHGQFLLTVTTTPLDKDIIAGPPAKISETMEMNLYIVDVYAKTIFSSTSMTVRGLGETENKCYLNAISRMPLRSQAITKFINEGKEKIIAYYDHEAPILIRWRSKSNMRRHSPWLLSSRSKAHTIRQPWRQDWKSTNATWITNVPFIWLRRVPNGWQRRTALVLSLQVNIWRTSCLMPAATAMLWHFTKRLKAKCLTTGSSR